MKLLAQNFLRNKKLPVLSPQFYLRDPITVARELLGKGLYFKSGKTVFLCEINEVEAYLHEDDPASHSFRGVTKRNWPMFEAGGTCYVYLCYGINHCVNISTEGKGRGSAILLRSAIPLQGTEKMRKNRGYDGPEKKLLNGPGKLTKGLGIDLSQNGLNYWDKNLKILDLKQNYPDSKIIITPRIGISKGKDLKLRFLLKD